VDAVRNVVPAPVDSGDRQRTRADVGGEYSRAGQPAGNGDGYGPAARPHVGDRQVAGRPMMGVSEDLFDQQLGLLAGDEHALVDREVQAVEFSVSNDIGQWFAGQPAPYKLVHRCYRRGVDLVVETGEEAGTVEC